jgi:hypothetical protein
MFSFDVQAGSERHLGVGLTDQNGVRINSYEIVALGTPLKAPPPGVRCIKVVPALFCDVLANERASVFLSNPVFDDMNSPESRNAWFSIGASVLRCISNEQHLGQTGSFDYIIPETAAFLRAVQTLYGDNLYQYPCIAFLFLTHEKMHVFIFQNGQMVRYSQEDVSEILDLEGLKQAANNLVATIHSWGLPPIDTVLVGGHHPTLHQTDLTWLPTFATNAVVDWILPGGFLNADPTCQIGTPGTSTDFHAVPLLVLGAIVSAETGWGADFNNLLSPQPVEHKVRKPVTFSVPQNTSPIALGAALCLVVMTLVCFLAWNSARKRENQLLVELNKEKAIETQNLELQKQCNALVALKTSLDTRAKWIQGNRDAQPSTNTYFTLLRQACPAGVVYTKLQLADRSVVITGFASVGAYYGTGKPAQSMVDLPGLVTQLAENLRGTGKFTEIEPILKQNPARDQVDFTINCNFTSPVTPTAVRVPPLSDTVIIGSGGTNK